METILTTAEITELVTTGMVTLSEDLILRLFNLDEITHTNLDENTHI